MHPVTRGIRRIVIHCAASPNGKSLNKGGTRTAAATIDVWHSQRGFKRAPASRAAFNPQLFSIGYHYVIDCDGSAQTGRALHEVGAHVQGHNSDSIGICLVGTDQFTRKQWTMLAATVRALQEQFPGIKVVGHRDLSPDIDGDGTVEPHEWLKTCPGFAVADWLAGGLQPLKSNLLEG